MSELAMAEQTDSPGLPLPSPPSRAIAHCLVGPPGSGKSTLARRIAQRLPHSVVVSTDQIRGDRYGDPAYQGDWVEIFAIARQQVIQAYQAGHPILYDATNAQPAWRRQWLGAFASLPLDWVGWYLQTPLATCHQWNRHRHRQVPAAVIDRLHQALTHTPPSRQEGFRQVYTVLPHLQDEALTQILGIWHSP